MCQTGYWAFGELSRAVALEYWRGYRTYFHIGSSWGISESTVCRIVHRVEEGLMHSGLFRLPGKKQLVRGFAIPEIVVMDVTETPIERPKRRQRQFYSGKKKRHTLKCQLVIEQPTDEIICTFFGQGRRHDFKLFQASGVHTVRLKPIKNFPMSGWCVNLGDDMPNPSISNSTDRHCQRLAINPVHQSAIGLKTSGDLFL